VRALAWLRNLPSFNATKASGRYTKDSAWKPKSGTNVVRPEAERDLKQRKLQVVRPL
jgi:hypothetical protein